MSISGIAYIDAESGASPQRARAYHIKNGRIFSVRPVGVPTRHLSVPINAPAGWLITLADELDCWYRSSLQSGVRLRIPKQQPEGNYVSVSPDNKLSLFWRYDRKRNRTGYGVCDTTKWRPLWGGYEVLAPFWEGSGKSLVFARFVRRPGRGGDFESDLKRMRQNLHGSLECFAVRFDDRSMSPIERPISLDVADRMVGGWYIHHLRNCFYDYDLFQPRSGHEALVATRGKGVLTKSTQLRYVPSAMDEGQDLPLPPSDHRGDSLEQYWFTGPRGRRALTLKGGLEIGIDFVPVVFSRSGDYVYGMTDDPIMRGEKEWGALMRLDIHTGHYEHVILPANFDRLLTFVENP
ncbi:MAG: hypothetical protein H8F28_05445 [Fibrella sp.]|nr:hypothetical protein [Armatimonadota bacterium]